MEKSFLFPFVSSDSGLPEAGLRLMEVILHVLLGTYVGCHALDVAERERFTIYFREI